MVGVFKCPGRVVFPEINSIPKPVIRVLALFEFILPCKNLLSDRFIAAMKSKNKGRKE